MVVVKSPAVDHPAGLGQSQEEPTLVTNEGPITAVGVHDRLHEALRLRRSGCITQRAGGFQRTAGGVVLPETPLRLARFAKLLVFVQPLSVRLTDNCGRCCD
jgi:hypothetical protein